MPSSSSTIQKNRHSQRFAIFLPSSTQPNPNPTSSPPPLLGLAGGRFSFFLFIWTGSLQAIRKGINFPFSPPVFCGPAVRSPCALRLRPLVDSSPNDGLRRHSHRTLNAPQDALVFAVRTSDDSSLTCVWSFLSTLHRSATSKLFQQPCTVTTKRYALPTW